MILVRITSLSVGSNVITTLDDVIGEKVELEMITIQCGSECAWIL